MYRYRPSPASLAKATRLGQEMARREPALKPRLGHAHQFVDYPQFVVAHRHELEHDPALARWDDPLNQLIESEEARCDIDLDDRTQWDLFYSSVATPIRCAFWYGWETAWKLPQLYHLRLEEYRRQRPDQAILRVSGRSSLPFSGTLAIDNWSDTTERLLDQLAVRSEDDLFGHCPSSSSPLQGERQGRG